ncbi:MAG: YqgE/AlgH family protein [Zoogloeaceae bacterium]|jgi:putative transcriptional regulator|nr:YqgE/AlgH family protein [Zoogloeaceae bacterium]
MDSARLSHHFLMAMPAMDDPFFGRALIYLCEHGPEGAMGLIVNRPLGLTYSELFSQTELPLNEPALGVRHVHFGGPVQTDRGFVLHRPLGQWQASLAVGDGIGLTSSRDVLAAIGKEGEPRDALVALGYAGWGAGQLEQEIANNAWLTVEADPDILFAVPAEDRLSAAFARLGFDITQLSSVAGHA